MGDTLSEYPFSCCEHCGCGTPVSFWTEREGHDDTCVYGCNDEEMER